MVSQDNMAGRQHEVKKLQRDEPAGAQAQACLVATKEWARLGVGATRAARRCNPEQVQAHAHGTAAKDHDRARTQTHLANAKGGDRGCVRAKLVGV
jgi:hypothetical protein